MDAKGKQAGSGVEFAVISALVFPGLDSKPRIPVGQNFRILAWIDRDRADIKYFRRRRLGIRRDRENKKRNHQKDFSHRRNHLHKFHLISSSLRVSGTGSVRQLLIHTVALAWCPNAGNELGNL